MTSPIRVRHYPSAAHILDHAVRPICSEHVGIARGLLQNPVRYLEDFSIRSLGVPMPAYHKIVLGPEVEMQYHLSGYGVLYEEALIRLAGEAVERYALIVAQQAMRDHIQYMSYAEAETRGPVVPFEYLRLFSESDYADLNRGQYHGLRALERDDVLGWISCASLFYPGRDILVPAQLLFVAYAGNRAQHELRFAPAFSTGTAAHSRADEALLSALLEAVEIDALMLHWYTQTPAPALSIDVPVVPELLPDLFSKHSGYDVLALDLRSLDSVDAHVIAAVLSNKKDARPLLVMGAQAHLDPVHAVYRAIAEAIAVSFLGIFGPVYLPGQYAPDSDSQDFTDLDRNVGFFANPANADEKRAAIAALVGPRRPLSALDAYGSDNPKRDVARLIEQLGHVSEYGVYLDITPPETVAKGWRVMRTFIPELVTMCVPGVPYSRHPRMTAFGGVRNRYPHPLP